MQSKYKIFLIIIISCLLLVVCCWLYYDFQNKKFEVIFFDIGQGDSALINLPGNNEILIDGGPDMTVLYKLGKYMPIYDHSIELMILTHPHADHVTGLVEVLNRYKVKKVMHTGVGYGSGIYYKFLKLINQNDGGVILKPENLDELQFDDYILEIIYPWEDLEQVEFDDVNDASIVFRLITTSGNKFLFTGDISVNIEKEILDQVGNDNLEADVLKVGHQGSDTSSDQNFVQAVNSDYAVISVGQNDFGHPSLRVVRRLERAGAQVLRTDQDGDVIFRINKAGELGLR